MEKTDNPNYLLYIEPLSYEKSPLPCLDGWIELMKLALSTAKHGTASENSSYELTFNEGSRFRGVHTTECGVDSKNYDYLLENGIVTNSLCKYYLIWYRNSIPNSEWDKLKKVAEYFNFDVNIKYISITNKKLHSSSELIILDTASWMDGGSFILKCKDKFEKRYDVEFHQNVNLFSLGKLAGRVYLDDILVEERSSDEEILLDLLDNSTFETKVTEDEKHILRVKIEYVRSDLFISTNQKVRDINNSKL